MEHGCLWLWCFIRAARGACRGWLRCPLGWAVRPGAVAWATAACPRVGHPSRRSRRQRGRGAARAP
eukprot:scaffold1882_cov36-Tisochrysis_lutea.AAC.3